jgi:hypothetical protein
MQAEVTSASILFINARDRCITADPLKRRKSRIISNFYAVYP